MNDFDPNGVGMKGQLFGLPYTPEDANLVIMPVPWEVTVSYGTGTINGPSAILEASAQVDLALREIEDPWRLKMAMLEENTSVRQLSNELRSKATEIIHWYEESQEPLPKELQELLQEVNQACQQQHTDIENQVRKLLEEGKLVAMVGGDHSTPYGLIKALSEQQELGILQIDAHMDLRAAYEGFTFSHASIMYNVLQLPGVKSLTQVGIRDFCDEELQLVEKSGEKINVFFDEDKSQHHYAGRSFDAYVSSIIDTLPERVYISFDIDGLSPDLCPNTGTPVPGGLSFNEAIYIVRQVVKSGRTIVGFDLNEVAPGTDDWDANVGARVLFRLAALMGVSNKELDWK